MKSIQKAFMFLIIQSHLCMEPVNRKYSKQPPRHILAVIQYLWGVIESHIEGADIDGVSQKIANNWISYQKKYIIRHT